MVGWPQQLWRTSPKLAVLCAAMGIALITIGWRTYQKPRVWATNEVPIAFWAWRNEAPVQHDVNNAMQDARARALFLRAGQIDYQAGVIHRIRGLNGTLPQGIELHLVYNATRSLLAQLESVDETSLAAAIAEAFEADVERARANKAALAGLQVDIDVPTRLLQRYARTLRALRARLKPGVQFSITGLPTWMDSADLVSVLDQVDFWIPQCYGAEIPERRDQSIPISSPQMVARAVTRARELNQPFYAGLAAYSYVLLYNNSGALITVRGDVSPGRVAADPNLELVERRTFAGAHEWRYEYRVRADAIVDGLTMQAGDYLVVDMPSSDSLRVSARMVRELAGEKLRGICVFRLPASDDPSTLTLAEVAAALGDYQSQIAIEVRIRRDPQSLIKNQAQPQNWIVEMKNAGTGNALVGSLQVDLALRPGSFEDLRTPAFASYETLCGSVPALQPCSRKRANVIRLKLNLLTPGQTLRAILVLNDEPTARVPVSIQMQTDGDRFYSNQREVIAER
jgi:hypothetical protein